MQSELLAAQGWKPDKIDCMLFDQRHHKPRKTRQKLVIESACEATP